MWVASFIEEVMENKGFDQTGQAHRIFVQTSFGAQIQKAEGHVRHLAKRKNGSRIIRSITSYHGHNMFNFMAHLPFVDGLLQLVRG